MTLNFSQDGQEFKPEERAWTSLQAEEDDHAGCQPGNNPPWSVLSPSSWTAQTEKSSSEAGRSEDAAYNTCREATASVCKGYVHLLHFYRTCLYGFEKLRVNDITQSEDGSWWIHIHRQKTGTLSSVRLLDIPLKIIEKYREQRKDDKVFNLYSRTYFIMLAHQLGEVYGFELTFHKARHNFGTHITLSLGVPIETVGKWWGTCVLRPRSFMPKWLTGKWTRTWNGWKQPEWIELLACTKKRLLSGNGEGNSDTNCPTTKKRPCKEAVSLASFYTHRCSSLHLLYASSRTFFMSDSL